VLFILKSRALKILNPCDFIFKSLFGLQSTTFSVFLLSLIGGYPLGAKMLNDSEISKENACVMLNYCVNAGPAFIILAVGDGVFGSQKIGVILFMAHILPSFILALFFKRKIKLADTKEPNSYINPVDNFVLSATTGAVTVLNICAFVILFSVITAYLNQLAQRYSFVYFPSLFLEVTNAVNQTKNIYLISAILGFGGISIWCQIVSLVKRFRINYFVFILCRIFHAISSALITFFSVKIFGIAIPTLSNGKIFSFSPFSKGVEVGISLLIMGIVLIISLKNKNFTGNMVEEIV
jgi:hypothetical protein